MKLAGRLFLCLSLIAYSLAAETMRGTVVSSTMATASRCQPPVIGASENPAVSAEDIEYIMVCIQDAEVSDHPEAKHGAHPAVARYFEKIVKDYPARAIKLLITADRASTQMAQEMARFQVAFTQEWYETQKLELQARVDAKLAERVDSSKGLVHFDAVWTVKAAMKAAEKITLPPPGLAAGN